MILDLRPGTYLGAELAARLTAAAPDLSRRFNDFIGELAGSNGLSGIRSAVAGDIPQYAIQWAFRELLPSGVVADPAWRGRFD